jgi:transcription elongation factor GreA
MENQTLYLTPEGAAKLRKELEELKGPRRREIAERLRQAVQMGDLSENADYIAAKEAQAFLEGRIQELEAILKQAEIVEHDQNSGLIQIGSTVVVSENGRDPETFHIVGLKEADPRRGRISHESPIGKALLGKRAGDIVQVKTPGGSLELRILQVK